MQGQVLETLVDRSKAPSFLLGLLALKKGDTTIN